MSKIAVVLFNLGGPDSLDAVRPFLFNLFYDPAIIRVPKPVRFMLARLISSRRTKEAQEIYEQMGGRSPILPLTQAQAQELDAFLKEKYGAHEWKSFVCMRYWHPMTQKTVEEVQSYRPDEVILLPLYPQFSTTTSGSSLKEWKKRARRAGFETRTRAVGCYPVQESFIHAHAELAAKIYQEASDKSGKSPRILFSAHGLPKKIVDAGDPYQWQVEKTVAALKEKMQIKDLDYTICYQSRVGPLEWIKPSTDDEVVKAAKEGVPIVMLPVAFVSEHSETLVELDVQYRNLAREHGMDDYFRVPALGTHPLFIQALAEICTDVMENGKDGTVTAVQGKVLCPPEFGECACREPS